MALPIPKLDLKFSDQKDLRTDNQAVTSVDLSNPWTLSKNIQIHSQGSQSATATNDKTTSASPAKSGALGGLSPSLLIVAAGAYFLLRA
jgi:hypothetical protein